MFVFRNNTVERFFSNDYSFSGYDDFSVIPEEQDGYVWFYQTPIKYDAASLANEIDGFLQKFQFVLQKINPSKTIIAFTMVPLYFVTFTNNDFRVKEAIIRYNEGLMVASASHSNLKVIDLLEFTGKYVEDDLFDWRFYFLSQMGLNPKLAIPFKQWFQRKLDQIALRRKKCLVLDLDNTLWGGVLGEEGIDGIQIGGDYPGKAFLYFQQALLELSRNGVILTVCSKNNERDVIEAWEQNPFMVLRKEHFAAWRINWQDKATNIKELAEELNLGLDSFVFIDDNPAERELVKQMLPMVTTPDFPAHPYGIPLFFKQLVEDYFKVYTITEEDKTKTEQYKANAKRSSLQRSFADFDEFLASLDIHLTIEGANEHNISRIAQMTQKTNQFNLTTKRYTDADIKTMLAENWKVWCISVSDRFGDSGITGCIIVNGNEIDTFLLSCRILGKGIEFAFIKMILKELESMGVESIKARYVPTAKNNQVKDFYEKCGFVCVEEDGVKDYQVNLKDLDLEIKDYYKIEIE